MSFGGSVSGMINSIKMNRSQQEYRRERNRQQKEDLYTSYGQKGTFDKEKFPSKSKQEVELIRKDLNRSKKKEILQNVLKTIVTCLLVFSLVYLFLDSQELL